MMHRLAPAMTLAFAMGVTIPALAQEQPVPPADPAGPPEELAQPDEPPPPSPPSAADSSQVVALFDQGITLLIQGDFEAATRAFEQVAQQSVEMPRRAAAQELARASAQRIGTISATKMPEDEFKDKDVGRASFLTNTILIGANYGWIVPTILDVNDTKAFVGLYLLTASASFAVPYIITRKDHITRGMSTLGGVGATFGFAHGALLYGTLAGENGFESDKDVRLMLTTMLGMSIAEGTLGYLWAKESRMSAGEAFAISSGSLWGLGFAAGANILIEDNDPKLRLILGSMLAGSVVGGYGGKVYSDNRRLTEGDASLVSYTGVLGAYAALAPLISAEVTDSRAIVGTLMGGAAVGLVTGDFLTSDKDYSRGQAGLVVLGSLAGGLLGAGGTFLLTPDDAAIEKWIVPGSAAGAIAGLLIMLKAVEPTAEPSHEMPTATMQLSPIIGPNGETGFGVAGTF